MARTLEPAKVVKVSRQSVEERYRERRMYERFALGGAFGHLISRGVLFPCQFIDISLGGCCLRAENPFTEGALAPVEIVLLIFGLVLRIDGVTQWTTQENLVGVRFMHPSSGSKNQLAALLTCLIDRSAAAAVREAVAAASEAPGLPILVAPALASAPAPSSVTEEGELEEMVHGRQPAGEAAHKPMLPIEEEWPAVVRFLKSRAHIQGLIVDLKPEGCTVRTGEPFPGGLNDHVELSFCILGLPFQLAGVTAVLLDQHNVDIRFLVMSRRKREELRQVLEELREAKERAAK